MSKVLKTISAAGALGVGLLGFSGQAFAIPTAGTLGALIINEWNGVAPDKILQQNPVGNHDPAFGSTPAVGNGGNWAELVVVGTNVSNTYLDIRGWTFHWTSLDGTPDETGTITFADHSLWQNLKPGTIITIRRDTGYVSDPSYNPCPGDAGTADWVINISATDTTYVTMGGVNFHTDNDGWLGKIVDNVSLNPIQNWVGESENPSSVIWNGDGINSQEVGKLEQNPSTAAASDSTSNYNDGNSSTFGAPNCWDNCSLSQNFGALRACP